MTKFEIEESYETWEKMQKCKNCHYRHPQYPHMGLKPCKKHHKLFYRDKIKCAKKLIECIKEKILELEEYLKGEPIND